MPQIRYYAPTGTDSVTLTEGPALSVNDGYITVDSKYSAELLRAGFVPVSGSATEYTWASKPAASSVPVGTRIVVSDLVGGPEFRNNGTNWIPSTGMVTLAAMSGSITAPVASGTRVGGAAFLMGLPGGGIKIPAGLLIPRQSTLRIAAYWSKTGALAGMPCNTVIGTTNSFSDSTTTGQFIGAAATAVWNMDNEYAIDTSTRIQGTQFVPRNGVTGATASGEYSTNINTSADMFINFGSNSGSDGDGLLLTRVVVQAFIQG